MPLPGQQLDRISDALRAAYTPDSLTRLLQVRLDVRLVDVAGGEDFRAVVFHLVAWADRQGRLAELIAAALAENPRSPELAAAAAELGISAPAAGATPALQGPWYVPFARNLAFVGRAEELQRLHAALAGPTEDGGQAVVGIRPAGVTGVTGMGGMGKTQLAVEYAYRYASHYSGGVFWLNAAGDWHAEFAALGTYLDPSRAGEPQEMQIRAAADYLQAHPNCLLVFDNVEDPQQLRRPLTRFLLPAALPCAVLFTTRRHDLGGFRPVELPVLPLGPGLRLLLRHPSREAVLAEEHPEHAEAVQIYKVLGGLPLALEIAGAHLGRRPAGSLQAYREELLRRGALAVVDDRRGGVRDVDLGTRHAAAVAAALAEQWEGLGEDARRLLRAAAELPEASAIPLARLGLLVGLPEGGGDFFGTPLADAAGELMYASLLEDLRGDLVRLHPLVRAYAAQQTPLGEREGFCWECAARLIVAYDDLAVLEAQCARRGIDAVERDLVMGVGLLGEAGTAGPIGVSASLLLRAVRQESHTLRGWDAGQEPVLFREQWLKRAMMLGESELADHARSFLRALPCSHLEVTWTTAWSATSLVRTLVGHISTVYAVAVTLDGRYAVSGAGMGDQTLRMWDLATGSTLRTFSGHNGGVYAVALLPDMSHAISASGDNSLRIWNLKTGETVRTLSGHIGGVYAVALTPDGSRAISGSDDNTLRVWDLTTGETIRTLTGHSGAVRAVAVTPDGRWAITGSDDSTLLIWNLASGEILSTLVGHTGAVRAVAVTSDGRHVISGSYDKSLRVWDLAGGEHLRTLAGHESWVSAVAVTPDCKRVISGSRDSTLRLWDLTTGKTILILSGHADSVYAAAVTPDMRYAVSGSWDNTLRVWDLTVGASMSAPKGHAGTVRTLAVTPNGRQVISGSYDKSLRVWDLATGEHLRTLDGHEGLVRGVVVTPDSRYVISGSQDNTIRVWDLHTGRIIQTLNGHTGEVRAVALTPDGHHAITGSDENTLQVWDLHTGQISRILSGHDGRVQSVVVTPDGHHVVSGAFDNTVRVWDLHTGATVHILTGHTGEVRTVTVTPDGRRIISGATDHALRVWDLSSGEPLCTLTGHAGTVYAVAVMPDGRHAVSCSWDNTLRVWDLNSGTAQAYIILDAVVSSIALVGNSSVIVAGDTAGNLWCLRYRELPG